MYLLQILIILVISDPFRENLLYNFEQKIVVLSAWKPSANVSAVLTVVPENREMLYIWWNLAQKLLKVQIIRIWKKKKKMKIWKLLSTYKDSLTFLLQGKNVFVSKELYIWNTKY